MIDEQLLLEHLAATDACAPDSPLPDEAWTRDVALAEIERRVGMRTEDRTRPNLPRAKTSRGWLVATAAFVAVLVIGAAMLLWRTQTGSPDVVEEPTTTIATTTTPPPTTAAPSSLNLPDTWQRVGFQVITPVVGVFNMAETSSGLVVVGFDPGEEDSRQNGVILTSADGVTWTRLAEDDPAMNEGAVLIYGVTEGGPGLVAVGYGCENDAEPCQPYPTVWTSEDGTAWNRSAADPDVFGELGAMLDVIDTEHGIVAAGGFYTGEEDATLIEPTVWLSADGLEWERVWYDDGYDFSTATTITGFQALASSTGGRIVGVGTAPNDQGDFVAAVWTSMDGRAWERIEPNSTAFTSNTDSDISVVDVAAGPGGFVAVGTDGGTSVAIWHSPDGLTWTRADTENQPFENIGSLGAVDALGTGWIAAGPHAFTDAMGGTVTLWTSRDGVNWDRVHWEDPGNAMSVVTTDGGIAVAGAMQGTETFHAAVWAGPAFDPTAPPTDPGPSPAPIGPEPAPVPDEGLSCEDLAETGYSYAQAVSYWVFYGRPSELDADGTGIPCGALFPADGESVFGGQEALGVEVVADYRSGTFSATGPAVDAGLMCSSGTTEFVGDAEPIPGAIWRWEDLYTCDDGGGTFILGADEFIDDGVHVSGVWDIASGTGNYSNLTGGGGVDTVHAEEMSIIVGRVWLSVGEE